MATKGNTIPVHRLGEHTDQGYQLERMHAFNKADRDAMVMELHRDDHYYRGPGWSHQQPAPARQLCFLGDETSIGHFLALRQLARSGVAISGAILLSEAHHRQEFHDYFFGWSIEPLQKSGDGDYSELDHWVDALDPGDHADTMFYLAGYGPGVHGLRKLLQRKGIDGRRVRAQGFWA